jgi:hypothetical protein
MSKKEYNPPNPEAFDDPGLCGAPYVWNTSVYPNAIVAAAVMKDGRVWTGRRHCNCISAIAKTDAALCPVLSVDQGFLTDTELFVTRDQAIGIAFMNGQLEEGWHKNVLTSEDLW